MAIVKLDATPDRCDIDILINGAITIEADCTANFEDFTSCTAEFKLLEDKDGEVGDEVTTSGVTLTLTYPDFFITIADPSAFMTVDQVYWFHAAILDADSLKQIQLRGRLVARGYDAK